MGRGRGRGDQGESNEDAMWRMMSSKGNGRGGGWDEGHREGSGYGRGQKGGKGKDGGPPSSDQIPQHRRDELRVAVEKFAADTSATQLEMDSNINGLERKYLHEVASEHGYTTQSFGQGRDRYLTMFKPSGGAASDAPAAEGGSPGADTEVIGDEAVTLADPDTVTFTSVTLDIESRKQLREFCAKVFKGGVPGSWRTHCEHMTICLGPLSKPQTEDNRSVADAVHNQIAKFTKGQKFDIKIVSTGMTDDVMAVGVVGCVSCNRNPHITVATAPNIRPVASNKISKWQMLPVEKQMTLHGVIVEHGADEAAAATGADLRARVLADTVLLAKVFLAKQKGGRPSTSGQLEKMLQQRVLPNHVYAVHPGKLTIALGDAVPQAADVAKRLNYSLEASAVDPFNLFRQPFNEVPCGVVNRVKRLARKRFSEQPEEMTPGQIFQCVSWLVSQAHCRTSISAGDVIKGLVDDGAIKIIGDEKSPGKVEYLRQVLDFDESASHEKISNVAYRSQWPVGPPPPEPKVEEDEAEKEPGKGKGKKGRR